MLNLFLRGDFYEAYNQDAKTIAEICDLVVTSRASAAGDRISLTGLPVHSVGERIREIIAAGYTIQIQPSAK